MWQVWTGICALLFIVLPTQAWGQTYADLIRENEQLKARLQAFEDAQEVGDRHHEQHAEEHLVDHAQEEYWHFDDPFYPGWWLPSDEYRPFSWMAPPSEGFFHDLVVGPFVDTHRSSAGTPWVHPFTIEPPQIHRDAFFIYKYTNDADGGPIDEHEAEVHVDWGLTRRFGILLAAPYLGLTAPGEQATGFGDLEIAPRIVFVESETFYLATNILMTIPTGDETRDLGAGEMTMAPFLTTWNDLGCCALPWTNWNTLFLNFGPEMGLESGDTSLHYTVVFAHSILGPKLLFPHLHGNGDHSDHESTGGTISVFGPTSPVGLTNFIVEFNGQTELQDDRLTRLQLLTGVSYVLTDCAELRFGVNLPLNHADQQMDAQYIFAFTQMF